MKSVVFLISLVVAFSSSCTSQDLEVVRDTDGDILRSDIRYFVVPAIVGPGGGAVTRGPLIFNGAAHDANLVCPSQLPVQMSKGTSVYVKPKAAEQEVITEFTDVNIEFENVDGICNNTVWEVEEFAGQALPIFLSTNGKAGDPTEAVTWFQIKKADALFYTLAFCPFGAGNICWDIGIQSDGEQRRLAIGKERPFYVAFMKDSFLGIKSII